MTSLAPIERAVQTPTPAQDAYRAHVFGDCDYCARGFWCAVEDRLDYLAACEDTRREKNRG
jgi:hypothetical protein